MLGVYGMFAGAVLVYSLRNIVKPEKWSDKWIKFIVIMLNVGLAGMVFLSLLPVGYLQIKEAFFNGYAASRSAEFLQQDTVQTLLTLRAIPDTFLLIDVAALAVFSIKALFNLRKVTHKEEEPLPVKDLAVDGKAQALRFSFLFGSFFIFTLEAKDSAIWRMNTIQKTVHTKDFLATLLAVADMLLHRHRLLIIQFGF